MSCKRLLSSAVVAFILLASCQRVKSQQNNQTQPATMPEFLFSKMDGAPFRKENIATDKSNLIIFFDASCEHCQREVSAINKNLSSFKHVNFYMVSLDERPEMIKFMEKYGPELYRRKNVTLLWDKNRIFIPTFMPTRYPAMYLYSKNKELIKYWGGDKDMKELIATVNGR
ncbi:redoxin domain-containing protein [Pedobacter sp. BS3]|uniref:peroxiredoxin family protein n=1 Tax=Pedobacter sp. BS3 TaxID=2567937 RepID=UPI0011EF04A8|nr:redoxin domain-containing protein [Pedobacter sp. BS3]TZF83153.1 redoxin domain-containing protein [Pedobacter sp. BS3]